jgi:hypothetical protein
MRSTEPTRTPRKVTGEPIASPLIEPSNTTAALVIGWNTWKLPKKTMAPSPSRSPPSTKAPMAACLSAIPFKPFQARHLRDARAA